MVTRYRECRLSLRRRAATPRASRVLSGYVPVLLLTDIANHGWQHVVVILREGRGAEPVSRIAGSNNAIISRALCRSCRDGGESLPRLRFASLPACGFYLLMVPEKRAIAFAFRRDLINGRCSLTALCDRSH